MQNTTKMNLFEQIVMAVNEELGISSLVSKTAKNIVSMIGKDAMKNGTLTGQKSGTIKGVNVFGETIEIYYTVYCVDSSNVKLVRPRWTGAFNADLKRLTTSVIYLTDKNEFIDLDGTTQHELEHMYQSSLHGKSLISKTGTRKIYNAAKKLMNSSDYFEQIVGYSVYYANKFEQNAYANTVYRMLMNSGTLSPMDYIKETGMYKNIKIIEEQLGRDTQYFVQSVENICVSNFGRHYNWWKNLTKKMISKFLNQIGKAIAKYEKDREGELIDPNVVMNKLPQFTKEEDE